MKNVAIATLVFYQFHVSAQDSYNIDWINKDLSPYSSYMISEFKVNDQILNYKDYVGSIRFVEIFNVNMSKIGLKAEERSVLEVLFNIELDTLATGFERPEGVNPEDKVVDLTLTLRDNQVNEKLVIANFSSITREPKKLNKEVKKMIKQFFREAKID
ncbi:MAG: hypothetical protein ABJG78_10960 [Cyclobacteriaceae bacterium]